jgi:hypothetical protein
MRTPAGTECKFFYGNYFRGRKQEECRLIGNASPPHHWSPDLCKTCPVPGIIRANACPNLEIRAEVGGLIVNFRRRVKINSFCTKSGLPVAEPEIGCGQCHPLPPVFTEKSK